MARKTHRIRNILLTSSALVAFAAVAHAQDATSTAPAANPPATAPANSSTQASQNSNNDTTTIIVTGTLIRGVAPTGTDLLTMNAGQIETTGATNTDSVLAHIPEITTLFNTTPALSPTNNGLKINPANIRNLGAASGSTTLILVDGHRMVNTGDQTYPDADVIPPFALERVEVMPDGGSAIYGADAVGGVINLITRKTYDGFEISGHAGYADHYNQEDLNLITGKTWDTGGIYIAANYASNSMLTGQQLGYTKQISPNQGYCAPGTVQVSSGGVTTNYALPNFTPNTMTSCDNTLLTGWIPQKTREAVYLGFTQDITDRLHLDVHAFYSRLDNQYTSDLNQPGNWAQQVTITSANPYYHPLGANDPGTQTVLLSYQGVFNNTTTNVIDSYQITPTLTYDAGHGWQIRALASYGRTALDYDVPEIDPNAQSAALAATTTALALDPYNLAATNPYVLREIYKDQHTIGWQDFEDGRIVADGPIWDLPSGKVRLAVGLEGTHDIHYDDINDCCFGGAVKASRSVGAEFFELSVPLVGGQNPLPGIQSLTIDIAGRNDDYSDFGNTFNPKYGFTWKPIDWVSFRGNWGTSFVAPSLADKQGAPDSRVVLLSSSPFVAPGSAASVSAQPEVILAGGNPTLKPQKATTWSLGTDIKPPVVPGLTISATYYYINMTNQIGVVPFFDASGFSNPAYGQYIIKNPTQAEVTQLSGAFPITGSYPSIAALFAAGQPSYLIDARRANFGELRQNGVDFNVSYVHPTDWGNWSASAGGTDTLKRNLAAIPGTPWTNDLAGTGRFDLVTQLGVKYHDLSSNITWSHTDGYPLGAPAGTQTKVNAFDTVDLAFIYDLHGQHFTKGLTLELNVDNLFDEKPPFYNSDPGYANGLTVGRYVQVGVDKKF